MTELLSKDHRILEKGFMDHRPFGVTPEGEKIRDVSGVTVRANVEYLEESVARNGGQQAVEELCRCLNERIRDPSYHVTPSLLKNVWNSYSYEFTCFLGEFSRIISSDPQFHFHAGYEKFLFPIIQTLGRPFSVAQIYRMFPHFGEKFAKGSIQYEVRTVTNRSAILRMKFMDHVYRQFGPYRKACADLICQSAKGGLAAVPEKVHHLKPATIKDLACIAEGDEWCEWEFTWTPLGPRNRTSAVLSLLSGGAAWAYLRLRFPDITLVETLGIALFPALAVWLIGTINTGKALVQEQLETVETQHEELREVYLKQEQMVVELSQKVRHLTALHEVGTLLSLTLDQDLLLETTLGALLKTLHYDRAMLSFYDQERHVAWDARVRGVSNDIAVFARSIEIPVTDPNSVEGMILLDGKPMLAEDIRTVWDRLHPFNQQLATLTQAKSIVSVPLKLNQQIIGAITVDRVQTRSLGQDDVDVLMTVARQLSMALANAQAYREIKALNVGLEARVRERTAQLEEAGRQTQRQAAQLAEWNQTLEQRVADQVSQLERTGRLKRFFSPQLADLIVDGRTEDPLKSHRQDITVVFLDLRGYSSFAEVARPEDIMELLHEYHTEMGTLIMKYNGTLERFTGDGMMIFFNDPVPVPNPAEQAVRMACAMHHKVMNLRETWSQRGYPLGLGIGIATGLATLGAIGFEGRWDYAAIGPVTNLASRLCSEAQSGQILVSRQLLSTVGPLVETEFIGELMLKGLRQPITTYNIKGLKA